MGKKVDLNAPRNNSTGNKKTGNNHSFSNPGKIPRRIGANSDRSGENTGNIDNPNVDGNQGSVSSSEQLTTRENTVNSANTSYSGSGTARSSMNYGGSYGLADKIEAIIQFPKNIKIVIIAAIILIPLLFLMLFPVIFDDDKSGRGFGLGGYAYYADAATQVFVNGELMDIEEYVARVLPGEVGEFDGETLKAFAVSIRTFVIANAPKVGTGDNAYYNVTKTDDSFQVYSSNTTDKYRKVAEETKGLIITVNGKISPGNYDASCVYTADQAKAKDSTGNFDDNNYYIKYGEWTIGGVHFQPVDKSNISGIGSLNHYASLADSGTPCSGNHGGGMSQNGAYYLEKNDNYDWKKIINYYYNDEAEIMSIYKSYGFGGYSGDYPIEPNNELYSNLEFLINQSFTSVMSQNNSSVEEFNDNIKSSVESAGVGTRSGVVTAGVSLIGSLAEMGYKLNYQWGGKYEHIGINPNWGTLADMSWLCSSASYGAHYDSSVCTTNYKWSSLDCSGFVTWAVINGMQKQVSQSSIFASNRVSLSSSQAVCEPGGVLVSSGHIVLVVGLDDENKRYIVAESTGSRISTGVGGVKLSYYSYGASGYQCSNLNDIYGD